MKTYNKEKILKEGTMREKIKLYFTHIALLNVFEIRERLLNQEEIMFIYNNIKESKDIKFYDTLRRYSMLFEQMLKSLLEKDRYELETKILTMRKETLKKQLEISLFIQEIEIEINLKREDLQKTQQQLLKLYKVNLSLETLELQVTKELKETIVIYNLKREKIEKEIELLKLQKEHKEKIKLEELLKEITIFVEDINYQIDINKTFVEECYLYLYKLLPLPIYREFVKKEEKMTIQIINNAKEEIEKILKENSEYIPKNVSDKNNEFYIYSWDDIGGAGDEEIDLDYYKSLAYG